MTEASRVLPAPLGYRDFRLFWTGSLLSNIGSQFTLVAMAWQIYELTNSPLQVGFLGLARAIPQILLFLIGGLLADAVNRRKLMMCTQTGLCAISTTLALLTFAGRASPLMLYLGATLLALFTSLDAPARQSLTPNLIPRAQLGSAMALDTSQRQISAIAGPSLAGMVIALLGPGTCYAADALSWLVMLVALALLRTKLQEGKGWGALSLNSLREGLNFVWGHAIIFPFMLLDCGATFFGSVRALLPIYARDILVVGPVGLGVLYSAIAAGSLLVAGTMTLLRPVWRAGTWIIVGVSFYAVCTALFAVSQTFWFSVLMLACVGAGNTVGAILRHTINQLSTPDDLRGRMSSVNSIFTNSGPQLGQFESGVVAAWLGAELSALTGALATLVIVALVAAAFPRARNYRIIR